MRRSSRRLNALCAHAILLISALSVPLACSAQGDRGSLTDQFPNMSAKERARIAAQEKDEAGKDGAYQALMQEGERAFQEGRYEEALATYEKARAMRPYNVYPKVKIEDLRTLLKKQAPTSDPVVVQKREDPVAVAPHAVDSIVVPKGEPAAVTPPAPVPPAIPEEHPTPKSDPGVVSPAPAERRSAAPVGKRPEGVIERRYREGHAYVIERAVEVEGRLVVYKRVYHNYGQVFYFEDGLAVDERVWKQRFPGE